MHVLPTPRHWYYHKTPLFCVLSISVAVSDHFGLYKIDDSPCNLFCTLYPFCGHVGQGLLVLLTSVEEWSRGKMKPLYQASIELDVYFQRLLECMVRR